MNTNTDYEIIQQCLNGDQDQFSILVTRYKRLIYKVVYQYFQNSEDINDISQEVFINIYKSLNKYNPMFKFSTWVCRITVNLCLDARRKKKLDIVSADEIEFFISDKDTPEKEYLQKEKNSHLWNAINSLADEYKCLILMHVQNRLSYQQMAEATHQPVSIIKNRLFRARRLLKKNMLEMNIAI